MAVNDNKFTHVMFHNLHTVINTICIHSGYVQNIGILDQCNYVHRRILEIINWAGNITFEHMQTAPISAAKFWCIAT